VFFTPEASGSHLFVRVNPVQPQSPVEGGVCRVAGDACTVQVDVPEAGCAGCGGGATEPEFQVATPGGSMVFFTDTQKLTADGEEYGARGQLGDLYVCELHGDACTLRDLTPSGGVHDSVLGAGCEGGSGGGCYVYFMARGALAAGAPGDTCGTDEGVAPLGDLVKQSCNLYVRHYNGREWEPIKLVAALSGADVRDWANSKLGEQTARVSPNGRWLAFMSQRSLTGYDNRDAVSGEPDQEVYLYDGETGRLSCASCDPTGARPLGVRFATVASGGIESNMPLEGGRTFKSETWIAANVPGWTEYGREQSVYQSRYLSDSGRLFFDSRDGLVPKDVDGTGDVYEYEPEGVGDCGPGAGDGAVVFKAGGSFAGEDGGGVEGAGCVGLISSGDGSEEAAFLDASETGGDVFFLSTSQLSPLDVEGGRTLYDAQECTVGVPCAVAPPSPSPPCVTEASCKAAPSPQPEIFGSPASATFSGPGDLVSSPVPVSEAKKVKGVAQVRRERLARALRVCARERARRRRAACERQARGRYGALRARTGSGNGRRAG
jgi:hypothetical protein